jgi:polar amino acid transport system permease protein
VALRPYGNEVILMIKASAIASIVTVLDLMGETRFIFSKTYDLSFYLWAAVFYLVLVEALGRVVNAIERRITRHIRPAARH